MKKLLLQTRVQAILFNLICFPLIFILEPQYFALNSASLLSYPSSLILNTFTHSGLLHISMNMLVVWQFGNLIDYEYQKKERYFLYFFIGLIITAIMYLNILFISPNNFLLGYSGIALALIGASFRFMDTKSKKWIGGQLLVFHILIISIGLNISWEAHLVGFVLGVLYSYNRFFYKQPQNLPEKGDFEDKRSIKDF
jgi:membrane associated rhomboid family serine protease